MKIPLARSISFLTTWLTLQAMTGSALAMTSYENRCTTYAAKRSDLVKLCSGKGLLPSDQTRNISNRRLLCSSSTLSYLRTPEVYDFDAWADLARLDDLGRFEAYAMRRQGPEPSWQGDLAYETFEAWSWQSCELVTDGGLCGHKLICEEGRECRREPKTCWADLTHYELEPCSHESIALTTTYERAKEEVWNPDTEGYDDSLPNKYDLLTGESETVQVSVLPNRTGLSYGEDAGHVAFALASYGHDTSAASAALSAAGRRMARSKYRHLAPELKPTVVIGDAKNLYDIRMSGTAIGAQCRQGAELDLKVAISTVARDNTVTSPNPLRIPETWDGHKVEPLVWSTAKAKDSNQTVLAEPRKLQLLDSSAAVIRFLAEASQKGHDKAFYKNTVVRVRLVMKRWWWWDQEWARIYTQDTQVIKPSLNFMATKQDIALADLWEIDLDGTDASLFERDATWPFTWFYKSQTFRQSLRPNRSYSLHVSVYQKGLKVYKQSCTEDPSQWRCGWLGSLLGKGDEHFSPEIKIDFKTSKDFDNRSGWERFRDGINIAESFLSWLGRVFAQ